MNQESTGGAGAVVETVEICNCTNTQLERGETCGLSICPNNRHPRLDQRGEPVGVAITEEGRADDLALEALEAHPAFDRSAFVWAGSEHLGGGLFCASLYTGTELGSPHVWITEGEEDPDKFYACLYVAKRPWEEPEEPTLSSECKADELGDEVLRMLSEVKGGAAK